MKKNKDRTETSLIPSTIQDHPYLFLILLGLIVYMRSLFFGIVDLDDNVLVLENQHVTGHIANFYMAFTRDVFLKYTGGYYRPILVLTFFFDGLIGGAETFYYHFTNIVIHLAAVCVLAKFLVKFGIDKKLSFVFCAFFVVHPVLAQAVSWIPGRNDSLLFIFSVLSFYYIIDRKYLLHFFFFALAVFTKENAIAIAFIVMFYLYFIKMEKKLSFDKLGLIIGWSLIFAAWYLLRREALPVAGPEPLHFQNLMVNALRNTGSFLLYLGKVFIPVNLTVLPILRDSTIVYGLVCLALLVLMYVMTKQPRKNYIILGCAWSFLFMAPAIALRNDFMEHRMYVPMLGLFIIFSELDLFKNLFFGKKYKLIVAVSVLLIFIIINIVHSGVFKDGESFWASAVRTSPHYALSHKNMGCEFYKAGKINEAEEEFITSLKLDPKETMSHNNLGLIYMNKNINDKAEQEFLKEIEINPNYDVVQYNLGLLHYNRGDLEQARVWFEKSVRLNPNRIDSFIKLFECSMRLNDPGSAALYRSELEKRGMRIIQ